MISKDALSKVVSLARELVRVVIRQRLADS
jgi:hypothetical protein